MIKRQRQTPADTERARQLRSVSTVPERILWSALRDRRLAGLKFRRQVPVGPYFVDFICVEARLVIELDGESHEGRQRYDTKRTEYLESQGYRMFRVTNDDVFEDLEAVAIAIAREAGIDVVAWLSSKVETPKRQETKNETQ